jgi:hypothetical protein
MGGISIFQIKVIKSFLSLLLIGVLLIIGSCSSNSTSKPIPPVENITIINNVLKHQFTGPDKKLVKLLNDPKNATIIGGDKETSDTQNPTQLDLYLEEMYKMYFTEEMYSQFIGEYALTYQGLAEWRGNEIKINKIEIKQNKDNGKNYYFTANVKYQSKGSSEKLTAIKGNVHFSEDDKISKFELLSDGGLSDKMK